MAQSGYVACIIRHQQHQQQVTTIALFRGHKIVHHHTHTTPADDEALIRTAVTAHGRTLHSIDRHPTDRDVYFVKVV
jgi:hypothetical protein